MCENKLRFTKDPDSGRWSTVGRANTETSLHQQATHRFVWSEVAYIVSLSSSGLNFFQLKIMFMSIRIYGFFLFKSGKYVHPLWRERKTK
jgi:hypothetical protein